MGVFMKSMLLLAFSFFGSFAFATGETCFEAKNPASLSVDIQNAEGETIAQEAGASARLKLYRMDEYQTDFSELRVVTAQGTVATVSALRTEGDRKFNGHTIYYVECDGGKMSVTDAVNGEVTMTSDSIRADIECCDGTAMIKSEGTAFSQIVCD
jgi:hypothetical protein